MAPEVQLRNPLCLLPSLRTTQGLHHHVPAGTVLAAALNRTLVLPSITLVGAQASAAFG